MTAGHPSDLSQRERWRLFKDRCFAAIMAIGGVAVIVAILLIFFYLLYVVLPLFRGATIEPRATVHGRALATALIGFDEYAETGFRVGKDGHYEFFNAVDGAVATAGELATTKSGAVTSVAAGDPVSHVIVAGTARGRVVVAQMSFEVSFPQDRRVVTPKIAYPLGHPTLRVATAGESIRLVTGQSADEETTIAAVTDRGRVVLVDRKSTRLNSSHIQKSRMPSSA